MQRETRSPKPLISEAMATSFDLMYEVFPDFDMPRMDLNSAISSLALSKTRQGLPIMAAFSATNSAIHLPPRQQAHRGGLGRRRKNPRRAFAHRGFQRDSTGGGGGI